MPLITLSIHKRIKPPLLQKLMENRSNGNNKLTIGNNKKASTFAIMDKVPVSEGVTTENSLAKYLNYCIDIKIAVN